ncbi:MAG: K+-dependent Na+/Ca+ exchanger [Candidatus Dojkabacteria bacterium]|nr:MAG: K+-dependent Na+/Ca+ exchanger [Candidatus Dojkabacteria bacterium]
MFDFFILFGGLLLVIEGANFLVKGASSLAKKFGLSDLVIGLTVVAFGTSLPEMMVSVLAGINGNSDLVLGNVIGSNISNILLILGLTALVSPLRVDLSTVKRQFPFLIFSSLVLVILMAEELIEGTKNPFISRLDGLILLSFFLIYIYYTFLNAFLGGGLDTHDDYETKPVLQSVGWVIMGVVGLFIGGELSVGSAESIAIKLKIDEAIIGLTVIAVGTSLPELVTSVISAYQKKTDIAIGNVVGSNIFNTFWILGVSSLVSPIAIDTKLYSDAIVMIIASILLFLFLFTFKKQVITKKEGAFLFSIFLLYVIFNVVRVVG